MRSFVFCDKVSLKENEYKDVYPINATRSFRIDENLQLTYKSKEQTCKEKLKLKDSRAV